MGTTKIICGFCKGTTELKNEELEAMREFRCANCNVKMPDQTFVNLKAGYYLGLSARYAEHFGRAPQSFRYEIDLSMKYTPDWAVEAALTEEAVHGTDNR